MKSFSLKFIFLLIGASFFLINPSPSYAAKTDCIGNSLPGDLQCFRSWCIGSTKVCESKNYCHCYSDGDIIEEGVCSGEKAARQNCTNFTTVRGTSEGCSDNTFVNTAVGCISTDVESGGFVGSLLQLAIGLGGGIALLLILYGTFIVTTSAGNPDKLKQGKEIIGSAISGLLFIILSIFLLNLIGVEILAIPGL